MWRTILSGFRGASLRLFSSNLGANHFDLVVLGSGPAAQKAAINAAKMKKKVAVVDSAEMLGGVCVHTGTIPSKTFREAVMFLGGYRQRGFYGKSYATRSNITIADILNRVRKVENFEVETVRDQLQRNRVHLVYGHGRFVDSHRVEVSSAANCSPGAVQLPDGTCSTLVAPATTVLSADNFLIATGTRPAHNPLFDFTQPNIFDSDQVLKNRDYQIPRELVVVGTGVIAMEYASMFAHLPGTRVTIIDERPTFLDFIDREIIDTLRQCLQDNRVVFRLGEKIVKVDSSVTDGVAVQLASGKRVKGDALLYAVGRQGTSDALNLPAAGVEVAAKSRGLLKVNASFQTNVPHIYAAGDIIGVPALASTAMEQGRLASQHMFIKEDKAASPFFPYGIYTIPEISVIGKSEQQLTKEQIPYEIGVCKFSETAKGAMLGFHGADAGMLKLLFCPSTHRLLGVHCIGESAAELIHIGQVVMSMGGSIEYFRDNVFNYPTFAESYRIAAIDGLNRLVTTSYVPQTPAAPSAPAAATAAEKKL